MSMRNGTPPRELLYLWLYELVNGLLFAAVFLMIVLSAHLTYVHFGKMAFYAFIFVFAVLRLAYEIYRIEWMAREGRLDELEPPKPPKPRGQWPFDD